MINLQVYNDFSNALLLLLRSNQKIREISDKELLSFVQYIKEYGVIKINAGRQTGKTMFILNKIFCNSRATYISMIVPIYFISITLSPVKHVKTVDIPFPFTIMFTVVLLFFAFMNILASLGSIQVSQDSLEAEYSSL